MTLNTDNLTDGTGTAEAAEAGMDDKAATVLSKFKDVTTLCKAYSELEAEFTRRSRRLKELEKANKVESPSDGTASTPSAESEKEFLKSALEDERVREAVIGDYLKSVSAGKGVPLISGGGGVAAPKNAPKSVKEAGRLAREFLKG